MVERTRKGTLRGMVGATLFPDNRVYLFSLREADTPESHMRDYEKTNPYNVGKALRKFGAESCPIHAVFPGPFAEYGDAETMMIRLAKRVGLPLNNMSDQRSGKRRPPFTPEHRAALSRALTGRTLSAKHRAAVGRAKRGKKSSDEARANKSRAQMGNTNARGSKRTAAQRANMRAAQNRPDVTAKKRLKLCGRKHTPEAIANMRAALVRRRERERAVAVG